MAEGICSIKQLVRIEKNISEPSIFVLHKLSSKLNIDLNEYYKKIHSNNSIQSEKYTKQIINYISKYDFKGLSELITILKNHVEFQSGSELALLYYAKALCLFNDPPNLNEKALLCEEIISLCEQGIKVLHPNFTLDNYNKIIYTDYEYSMLNLICSCYIILKEYNKCERICLYLINHIEEIYYSQSYCNYETIGFINRLYQHTLLQLSRLYFFNEKYDKSFTYIDKSIKSAFLKYEPSLLPELFEVKSCILYKMEKFEEALIEYRCAKNLYLNCPNPQFLEDMGEMIKNEYPKLIEMDNN